MINRKNNFWHLFMRTKNEDLKIICKQQQAAYRLALQKYNVNKVRFLCKSRSIKISLTL